MEILLIVAAIALGLDLRDRFIRRRRSDPRLGRLLLGSRSLRIESALRVDCRVNTERFMSGVMKWAEAMQVERPSTEEETIRLLDSVEDAIDKAGR